jgi:hypothetical protein
MAQTSFLPGWVRSGGGFGLLWAVQVGCGTGALFLGHLTPQNAHRWYLPALGQGAEPAAGLAY